MSYSLVPQMKKSKSFSKYLYSTIDISDDFFLFNIKLTNQKKKFKKKIKKITNSKSDNLINISDNIEYNKYSKMEIIISSVKNAFNTHQIEIKLEDKPIIFQDEIIYLEISNENNFLKCFFNLEIYN
tara:strand:+ start:1250 stop:1630 length:381 start_codon:yes stop_codon:yes gene_type:complete